MYIWNVKIQCRLQMYIYVVHCKVTVMEYINHVNTKFEVEYVRWEENG